MRQARRNPGKRSGCHVVHAGRGGRRKEQRSRGSDIWAEPPTLAWRRGYPCSRPVMRAYQRPHLAPADQAGRIGTEGNSVWGLICHILSGVMR